MPGLSCKGFWEKNRKNIFFFRLCATSRAPARGGLAAALSGAGPISYDATMSVVTVHTVAKQYGTQVVLSEATFELHAGETVGLVGANGSGKTTLFRLITGELEPDLGTITCSRGLKIGYLPQEPRISPKKTLHEEVGSVFADLLELEEKVHAAADQMAGEQDPQRLAELMATYDRLNDRFVVAGGHTFEARLNEILGGLGFTEADHRLPMSVLSGGQKCRAALAKLLLRDRSLLLLDEPTNHLDIDAVRWLEKFLAGHHGGAVIVSHDRYLLDRLCDRILELERTRVSSYPGNYSNYAKAKHVRTLTQQRQFAQDTVFIKKEQAFIAKHLAGQRTKEAQGRRTRLARRLKAGEFVTENVAREKTTKLSFEQADAGQGCLLRCDGLTKRYDDNVLFENLSFQVQAGQRLGITGPNGTGKTTLLKIVLGQVKAELGQVELDPKRSVGYYEQESATTLDPNRTVLDEFKADYPDRKDEHIRSMLGAYLFSGEDVFKPLGALSGGEQSRVRLAKLIMQSPEMLILDEPTNHLDIASREALESALSDFGGAVIVVSHDRYFLDRIVDHLLVMRKEGCQLYPGHYSYYIDLVEQERTQQQQAKVGRQKKRKAAAQKARPPSTPYDHLDLDEIEERIMARETELTALNERFGDASVYQDLDALALLREKVDEVKQALEDLNTAWEAHVAKM